MRHLRECVSVCAWSPTLTHSFSHIRVCVCVSLVHDSLYSKAALSRCDVCTWQSLE